MQKPNTPEDPDGSLVPADGLNMNSLTGDIVMSATREYDEPHRDAVRWLHAFSKENGWNLSRVSRELEMSPSTLYRVFTGKYGARLDGVVDKIRAYRKAYGIRIDGSRIPFVETSVAKKIFKAGEWALASNSMVFVFGNRGLGKTFCFERFRETHNHGTTKLVRMPASAGVQLMMKEIAKACYISPNSCYDNLRERVFGAIDSTNVVVVDELHQVFLSYQKGSAIKCLEVLREIHDRTGCGMVLSGTNQLSKGILGEHKELLEQFTDRGVLQVQLPTQLPMGDILLIAGGFGIVDQPTGAANEIVEEILHARSLRKFGKLLQAAATLAAKESKQVTWSHFVKAHDILARLGGTK